MKTKTNVRAGAGTSNTFTTPGGYTIKMLGKSQ